MQMLYPESQGWAVARKAVSVAEKPSISERVESVDRFVRKTANGYAVRLVPGLALDVDDLISVGRMGAMRAAEKFDPQRGIKFLSYAANWIRAFISREIDEKARTIRIPLGRKRQKELRLDTESGANVSVRRSPDGGVVSMDAPAVSDEGLHALLDSGAATPEELIAELQHSNLIKALLGKLGERDRSIVICRFFDDMTLTETGESLGISRERVRQLEVRAISKLRAIVRSMGVSR